MNRVELRQLAEDRLSDAETLIAAGRWSGAYYLAGYAVECGLKACVLVFVDNTGVIFTDRKYAEKCWTHSLDTLVALADLETARSQAVAANPAFGRNWLTVSNWGELSRYQQKAEGDARELLKAITDPANGVMQWIRIYW